MAFLNKSDEKFLNIDLIRGIFTIFVFLCVYKIILLSLSSGKFIPSSNEAISIVKRGNLFSNLFFFLLLFFLIFIWSDLKREVRIIKIKYGSELIDELKLKYEEKGIGISFKRLDRYEKIERIIFLLMAAIIIFFFWDVFRLKLPEGSEIKEFKRIEEIFLLSFLIFSFYFETESLKVISLIDFLKEISIERNCFLVLKETFFKKSLRTNFNYSYVILAFAFLGDKILLLFKLGLLRLVNLFLLILGSFMVSSLFFIYGRYKFLFKVINQFYENCKWEGEEI